MSAAKARTLALLARRASASTSVSHAGALRDFARGFADGSSPPPVLPPLQGGRGLARRNAGPVVTDVVQTQGDPWSRVTVRDTGEVYYWDESTGETTAVGEPRPTAPRRVQAQQPPQQFAQQPPGGVASGLGGVVMMGAGVGLAFALIGKMLGG